MGHCAVIEDLVQMNEQIDHDEWQILNTAVNVVCARHGKHDSSGHADYFVSDNNWGGVTQTLLVNSADFLTPKLVSELSNCITKTKLFGAQIFVILDIKNLEPEVSLIIDSQGATEEWDLPAIRQHLGNSFYNNYN